MKTSTTKIPFGARSVVNRGALSSIELILMRDIRRSGREVS